MIRTLKFAESPREHIRVELDKKIFLIPILNETHLKETRPEFEKEKKFVIPTPNTTHLTRSRFEADLLKLEPPSWILVLKLKKSIF